MTLWVVDDAFLGPADIILSGADAKEFGFELRLEESPERVVPMPVEVDDEEAKEWIPGPIRMDADVPKGVRRAVECIPVAQEIKDLTEPARVGIAKFNWKNEIPEEIPPIRRRLRTEELELLRKREIELTAAGIYVPGDSPYASPWLVIAKPKGGLRDVVDMRKVNEFMLGSGWPLTDLEDVKGALGGFSVYAELDLKAAYWQIPLA